MAQINNLSKQVDVKDLAQVGDDEDVEADADGDGDVDDVESAEEAYYDEEEEASGSEEEASGSDEELEDADEEVIADADGDGDADVIESSEEYGEEMAALEELYDEELEEAYGEEMLEEMYGEEMMEEMYGEEEQAPVEVNVNLELILPSGTDQQALLDSLNGAYVTSETTEDGINYQMMNENLSANGASGENVMTPSDEEVMGAILDQAAAE